MFTSRADNSREQVPCHRFDHKQKVMFKRWYCKYIAVGPTLVAYGSTKDKTMSRALGGDAAVGSIERSFPIAGCQVTALESHHGRSNVMVLASPGKSFDNMFAFDSAAARDAFMLLIQARQRLALGSDHQRAAVAKVLLKMQLQVALQRKQRRVTSKFSS